MGTRYKIEIPEMINKKEALMASIIFDYDGKEIKFKIYIEDDKVYCSIAKTRFFPKKWLKEIDEK
jgi:uncharacterized protein YpmS